jgi:hypothetical protein
VRTLVSASVRPGLLAGLDEAIPCRFDDAVTLGASNLVYITPSVHKFSLLF